MTFIHLEVGCHSYVHQYCTSMDELHPTKGMQKKRMHEHAKPIENYNKELKQKK